MRDLTKEEHKKRHIELHQKFDELIADFIFNTKKLPLKTTLKELIDWSHKQTINPD